MPKTKPTTVNEYIKAAPREAQAKLREIRALLKKVVPGAKETLKQINSAHFYFLPGRRYHQW